MEPRGDLILGCEVYLGTIISLCMRFGVGPAGLSEAVAEAMEIVKFVKLDGEDDEDKREAVLALYNANDHIQRSVLRISRRAELN